MWRIARQRSRAVTTELYARLILRQKHIPSAAAAATVATKKTVSRVATTVQKNGKANNNSVSQGNLDIVDPFSPLSNNEPLFQLPLINIGDYVEAFRNGQYSGMVIGQKKSSGGLQQLTILLRNGKTFDVRSDNVAYCYPEFCKSQQVSQTVTEPVNFKDIDSNGLLQNIPPSFNRAIQNYQRTLNMTKAMAHQQFELMYKQFEGDVVLDDLASFAFHHQQEKPTALQRHVTFLHLVSDNIHFIPTRDVRASNVWSLRPQEECNKISEIITSIRTRDEKYTGFLSRAKALIQFYNNHADPVLGTLSPSVLDLARPLYLNLISSDKVFINFVADWIRSPKVIVDSPYEVFVPNMLKALKCYDTLFFDRSLAIRFLKEVGMLKPWDNVGLVEDAAVAGEFIWSKEAQQNAKRMNEFTTSFLSGTSQDFNHVDPYSSIRHDFGDLPVYTIDDPSAKEIDDGISIQHDPKGAWLHVHIADPTTYISPSHELSDLMCRKVQTLYLPERHFPMLPEALSSQKFSLGSTAHTNEDGSQYALTFSTKMDQHGNLTEYKIQPSLVKNVKKVYYDDLDELLKTKTTITYDPLVDLTKTFSHPHSTSFAPRDQETRPSTVTEECKKDLLDIFALSNVHAEQRRRNGAVTFSKPSPVIELLPDPLDLPQIQFTKSNYATTLPAIRVRLDKSGYSPARLMVAETMIMGGRIASKFAQEHQIPLPFRTQAWNPFASTTDLQLREEMLASRCGSTGMVPMADMVRFMSILPPSTVTTTPGLPHVIMGIQDGYTRATSPLRRFLDVVVHWQIKSRLLGTELPYSLDHVKMLAKRIETREKQLSLLQQRSTQFWVISLLDRMRVDGFTMEWNCIVNMPSRTASTELGGTMEMATGTLLELGIRGRIVKLKREVHVGEVVKVRVAGLDPLLGRVNLELI